MLVFMICDNRGWYFVFCEHIDMFGESLRYFCFCFFRLLWALFDLFRLLGVAVFA